MEQNQEIQNNELDELNLTDQEKELLSQKDVKPEDILATMHYLYVPQIKAALPKMSKKTLSRIVQALVEIPINYKTYNRFTPMQKAFYNMVDRVLVARVGMQFENLRVQWEKEQAEKAKKNLEVGVTNGTEETGTPKEGNSEPSTTSVGTDSSGS